MLLTNQSNQIKYDHPFHSKRRRGELFTNFFFMGADAACDC